MALNWEDLDFGQVRAKDGAYEFVIWTPEDAERPSELRVIRKDNVGGIIAPIQDFSVYAGSKEDAIVLAETISAAFAEVAEYNELKPLFD